MKYLSTLNSTKEADAFLKSIFVNKKKLMGFGHRVYKNGDPRHPIAKKYSELLSKTDKGNFIRVIVLNFQKQFEIEFIKFYEK